MKRGLDLTESSNNLTPQPENQNIINIKTQATDPAKTNEFKSTVNFNYSISDKENGLANDSSKFKSTGFQQSIGSTLTDTVFREFRATKNNSPKSRLKNIYSSNGSPDKSRMNISKIEDNIGQRANSVAVIINGSNEVKRIIHPPRQIKERSGSVNNLADKRLRVSQAIYGGSIGNTGINSNQNLSFFRRKILDTSAGFSRNFSVNTHRKILKPFNESREGKENVVDTINITVPKYSSVQEEDPIPEKNSNKTQPTVRFSDIAGYGSTGSQPMGRPGTAGIKTVSSLKLKKMMGSLELSSSNGFNNFNIKVNEKKLQLIKERNNEIELIDNYVEPGREEVRGVNVLKIEKKKPFFVAQRYSSTGRTPTRF